MNAMNVFTEPVSFDALDACHQQILAHLVELEGLARQVAQQRVDAAVQKHAGAIEAFFSGTSRQHHAQEEESVFPPLLASGDAELVANVRVLQQDHGWIEENWIELAPQLRAIAEGNNWMDADELLHGVTVFADLLRGHIALEETIIYPASKERWAQVVAKRLARAPR